MMGRGILFSLLSLVLVKATAVVEDGVFVLGDDDFNKFIDSNEAVFVKFYAPWCGHCKSLAPEYARMAQLLNEEGSKIVVAKVDCDVHKKVSQEFAIRGYPTLKFFKNGIPIDYQQEREAEKMISWANKMLKPAVVETSNPDSLITSKDEEMSFIAHGCTKDNSLCKEYEQLAERHRTHANFYSAPGPKVSFEVRHPEDGPVVFEGHTPEELAEFVTSETLPILAEITSANYYRYTTSGKDISWFCGTAEEYKKYRKAFVEAAKALRSSVVFVWLDTTKFTAVNEAFAIEKLPAVAHQTLKGRFILQQPDYDFSSKDSLLDFYKHVQEGKIPVSFRSEAEPLEQPEGAVKVVVGKTLPRLFEDSTRHVLLFIYAPHCEHCRNFKPAFEEFANSIDTETLLTVAQMDGDANESPLEYISWDAFPTVLLFKAGSKEGIPFEGNRTAEDLKKFVEEHIGPIGVKTEL